MCLDEWLEILEDHHAVLAPPTSNFLS